MKSRRAAPTSTVLYRYRPRAQDAALADYSPGRRAALESAYRENDAQQTGTRQPQCGGIEDPAEQILDLRKYESHKNGTRGCANRCVGIPPRYSRTVQAVGRPTSDTVLAGDSERSAHTLDRSSENGDRYR